MGMGGSDTAIKLHYYQYIVIVTNLLGLISIFYFLFIKTCIRELLNTYKTDGF